MKKLFLVGAALLLAACSGESGAPGSATNLEAVLQANDTWPYEMVGVLDIVEAGYGDSDNPEWAVGSIITDDDEWGVQVEIQGNVISRAGINIDSGKPVRAWLEAPEEKYGVMTYAVSKLEAL